MTVNKAEKNYKITKQKNKKEKRWTKWTKGGRIIQYNT